MRNGRELALQVGLLISLLSIAMVAASGCLHRSGAVVVPERPIDPARIEVVYGFGARQRGVMRLEEPQRAHLEKFFNPPAPTGRTERHRIRQAIEYLERVAGEQLPIAGDVAFNGIGKLGSHQLDCVDEATNTTTFLRLLKQNGWLRHHVIRQPVFRAPGLVNPHNSACIREIMTGVEFVVDSWYRPHGQLPLVQPVDDWRRKRSFSREENPELGVDPS